MIVRESSDHSHLATPAEPGLTQIGPTSVGDRIIKCFVDDGLNYEDQ